MIINEKAFASVITAAIVFTGTSPACVYAAENDAVNAVKTEGSVAGTEEVPDQEVPVMAEEKAEKQVDTGEDMPDDSDTEAEQPEEKPEDMSQPEETTQQEEKTENGDVKTDTSESEGKTDDETAGEGETEDAASGEVTDVKEEKTETDDKNTEEAVKPEETDEEAGSTEANVPETEESSKETSAEEASSEDGSGLVEKTETEEAGPEEKLSSETEGMTETAAEDTEEKKEETKDDAVVKNAEEKTAEEEITINAKEETASEKLTAASADTGVVREIVKQMKLEAIDYQGQGYGDATMLSSNGKNLLIDTYSPGAWSALRDWLKDRGYSEFDIYLSHYHDDHMGNITNLIHDKSFKISKLYLPVFDYMTGTSTYMRDYIDWCKDIIQDAKDNNVQIQYIKKNSSFTIGDVTAKVLWGTTYKNSNHDTHYINNNSLVTKFTCDKIRYLNAGDIEKDTENEILKAGIDVSAEIFKLSHHGGNSSNTDAFLKAVGASYHYYNYNDDSPSRYSPSGSWSYTPTQNAKKYGNVASVRYNGNITYEVFDNIVNQELDRNYQTQKVYLYDKKDTNKLVGVVDLETNKASTKRINKNMYKDRNYSTTKKSGTVAEGWIHGNEPYQYYYVDGKAVTGWKTVGGKKYHFDTKTAAIDTGWNDIDGKTYYLGDDGVMRTGFVKIGTATHYFNSDGSQQKTGWAQIDGKKYYFGAYNKLMFGLQTIGGKKYTLDAKTGALRTGLITIGGKKYYSDASGVVQTGWRRIDGNLYYFGNDGVTRTGFVKIGSSTFYFNSNGVQQKAGWATIGGKKYYFGTSNRLVFGIQTINGKKYTFDEKTGALRTGFVTIGGNKYYSDGNGVMQTGWKTINGAKYYFASSGIMETGWTDIGTKTYYFNNGKMVTGWFTVKGKLHYFWPDGHEQMKGTVKIDGKSYTFDKYGVCQTKR